MNTFVMGDKGMQPCEHTHSDGKSALETRDNAVYCTTCGLAVLTVATIREMKRQLMGAPQMSPAEIGERLVDGFKKSRGLE